MSITVNSNQLNIVSGKKESKSQSNRKASNYQLGDIVQGTVTKIADLISIQFSERTTDVSRDVLPNVKEGDLLSFRLLRISKDGSMSLQYLSEEASIRAGKPAIFKSVLKEWKGKQLQDSGVIEKDKGVDEEKQALDDIHQKMTKEDYADLSKEGFSLEQYELERFDRALERIKIQRAQLEQSIDIRIETVKKDEEIVEKAGLAQIDDPVIKDLIAAMLESMNLPASQQNIVAVSGAVKLACEAVNLKDASMSYLLSNQMEPTPVNLYMANYNAKAEKSANILDKEAEWAELRDQVTKLLEQFQGEGILATQKEAKWLFDHELAINRDTMTAYQQLKTLQENLSINSAVTAIIKGMTEGKQAMDASLVTDNEVEIQIVVQQFGQVSDQALQSVIEQNKTANLINLHAAMDTHLVSKQNTKPIEAESSLRQEGQGNNASQGNGQVELQKEMRLVTARRQLEEIRVKLTYDAGLKLVSKGVSVQTESLDSLVEELRGLEQEYYEKLLAEGGAKVNDESVQLLRATLDVKDILSQSPSYVLAVKFEGRNQATLSNLAEVATQLSQKFQLANEAYEPLMTVPRRDMGDSIQKAFSNMDSFLEEMGIENTEANKRAVRILSYNQMEINKTSIEQMKEYDRSVRSLIQELKPSVTVQLIQKEINPLDIPIEKLKEYIHEIVSENGETKEEKYSNYLAKIQKSDTLTSEQRDTYIGVYRLLNNIEKSDGKVIGYLVNSGRELTLNNLLSAVRSIKGSGIDTKIDDSFGLLKEVNYSTKSIGEQLNAAFVGTTALEIAKTSYNNGLNSQLYDQMTPEFLEYVQNNGDLMKSSMEQISQKYQEYVNVYPQFVSEEYEALLSRVQEAMSRTNEMKFLKNYKEKVNLQNIASTNMILNHPKLLRQGIKRALDSNNEDSVEEKKPLESSETFSDFEKNYENVIKSVAEQLRESFECPTLTVEEMIALNGYINNTTLLKKLSDRQYYQISLEVSGQLVEVGLSLQSSSGEKGKISIDIDSETFGQIRADLKLEHGELKGLVLCENKAMSGVLKRTVEEVTKNLPADIVSTQIHVCTQSNEGQSYITSNIEETQDHQQTELLFQIAKVFLCQIKEMDYSQVSDVRYKKMEEYKDENQYKYSCIESK